MSQAPAPVALWAAGGYELAEGARWVAGRLAFVDILSGRLFDMSATEPTSPRLLANLPVPLGAAAPVRERPGDWIVAAGTGIALLHSDGELEWLDRPEEGGSVETRMNDAVCDPAGRFWAGSMAYDETPGAGSLYRTDHDGSVHKVIEGLTIANGPAFSADGATMYYADTPTGKIFRVAVDPASGTPGEPEVFLEIPEEEGSPDGMVVDNDGFLWQALWGGHAIRKYAPDGSLAQHIAVPAAQPTSVCLTPAGDAAFVTTARLGLNNPPETSGAIVRIDLSEIGLSGGREAQEFGAIKMP
jgi:sugar lactone lactonase YvrE